MGVAPRNEQPVGELLQQLSAETATLVRQELKLAQLELQQKGKRAGLGAGMFGGAGVVAVVLLAVGGVLALSGKKQVEKATPPLPEQALESVQRDVEVVKESAQR